MRRLDRDPPSPLTARIGGALRALFLPALLAFGLAGAALAAPTDLAAPTVEDGMPYGDGVLWKVERPGEDPSYLFGTIHLNRDDILAVPDAVKKALAGSRSASFEVLFDTTNAKVMARAYFTGGQRTLDALIGPELFADVVAAAEPYGLTVHHLRHMKPWALMLLFDSVPSVYEDEDEGKPILDVWLFEQAEEKGIPTFGLESMRQHLSPFMDIPLEDQRLMIKSILKRQTTDQTEAERRHAEMVRRYLDGDIDGILAMAEEDEKALSPEEQVLADDLMERLLDDRNHLMVERMLPRLEEGKAFVAVGAGHLPGEEGVLKLLTDRGYSVQRIH